MPKEKIVNTSAIAPARNPTAVTFSIVTPNRSLVVLQANTSRDNRKVSTDKFFIEAIVAQQDSQNNGKLEVSGVPASRSIFRRARKRHIRLTARNTDMSRTRARYTTNALVNQGRRPSYIG